MIKIQFKFINRKKQIKMNLTNKMFIVLSSVFLFSTSCNNDINDIKSNNYDDHDNTGVEEKIWYYENSNNIHIKAEYKNGKQHGKSYYFYENGNIKAIETHKNGIITDSAYYFYESGELKEMREYIDYLGNDYFLNTWVVYDSTGDIIPEESHYYTILNEKDTYTLGESENLVIELTCPFYNESAEVILGEFSDDFQLIAESQRIEFNGFKVRVPLNCNSSGEQEIKFIINDYETIDDSTVQVKPLFVKYKYLVK